MLRWVIIGAAGESPDRRELIVGTAFRQAGFAVKTQQDMRGWLWLHFASDAGMFAQALKSGGLANMIGDRRALHEAFLTSRELIPVIEARGVDLRRHPEATLVSRLPRLAAALSAWATDRLPIARASLASHTDPNAAEPLAVLEDVLTTADQFNIATPRLERAVRQG